MKYCGTEGMGMLVSKTLKVWQMVNYVVERFDYNSSGFCESCIGGKQYRSPFDSSERQTGDLLELIHSDVCGKINDKSIGGAQYFLTFTDDKSRYSWVYIIKMKDQVFQNRKLLWKKATKKEN